MIAIAVLSAPPTATAQPTQEQREESERSVVRRLVNGCQPIYGSLYWTTGEEQVDRDSLFMGSRLTESAEELVKNRLRLAGLYTTRTDRWILDVHLSTVPGAFTVELQLYERVLNVDGTFRRIEERYLDRVLVSAGTLGRPRRNHVLQVISERMDRFVLRYRRANARTCR